MALGFVLKMIDDPKFIKGFGHYVKFNDTIIVPKHQDVIYAKTGSLDVPGAC